jgi:hypothetical protein
MGKIGAGDGKTSAETLLDCARGPLRLGVKLDDKTGRLTAATFSDGQGSRSRCARIQPR